MQRTLAAMVVCLVVGAGGMWVLSNFRLKVEAVGGEPPPPPTTAKAESPLPLPVLPVASGAVVPAAPPQQLPPHLLAPQSAAPVPPAPTPELKPVAGQLPAMSVGATALGMAAPILPAVRIKAVKDTIDAVSILWSPTAKVLVAGATVDLELENAPTEPKDFRLFFGGTRVDDTSPSVFELVPGTGTATAVRVKLTDAKWPGGTVRVGVSARKGDKEPTEPDASVELVAPGATDGRQVTPGQYLDSPYLTAAAEVPAKGGTAIKLQNGYLRLKGQLHVTAASAVEFFTVLKAAGSVVTPVQSARQLGATSASGNWEYELDLGRQPNGTDGYLVVRTAATDGKHYYTQQLIPVAWQVRNTPAKPTFAADPIPPAVAAKEKPANADQPEYRSNQKAFTVAVNAVNPPDAQVLLLYVGDQTTPAQAKPLATETGASVTFTGVTVPGDGDHVVSVAGVNGNSEIGPRAKLLLKVHTAGPQAVSVSAPGFGTNPAGRETVSVQFVGERLDVSSFQGGRGFSLAHDQAGEAKAPKFEGVKYDPAANVVRLTYSNIVPGTYTFKVLAKVGENAAAVGVRDLFDNFLVGPNGTSVDDAVFTLTAALGQESLPSVTAGVTLQTGPNVTFPEYLHFRKVPDGFNPSDRVETRVVRLYYTRDAHRVAQVVNRDVRSYNAATVDVRRRAADRARDDANMATDARKRIEGEAVQAAADARAAETRLRDLQAKLTTARTEAATANSQLDQRKLQLDQFVRAGTRDQTNAGVRRDTDTSTDEAQRRVDDLNADLARLRRTVEAGGLLETDTPAAVNEKLKTARDGVAGSERQYAAAVVTARGDVEQSDPATKAARQRVTDLELERQKPNLTDAQVARLTADLGLAVQDLEGKTHAAISRRSDLTDSLTGKAREVEDARIKLQQVERAEKAVSDLVVQRRALADAKRELERAEVRARGRAATDAAADASLDTASGLRAEIAKLSGIASNTTAVARGLEEEIARAVGEVQAKRVKEVELNLKSREYEQQELRGRENQFRREVAAAREDPDTYAAGDPLSDDPVRQCSISVIGEGLIQLRGPVKGLNVIRTMINQMDAPTGQVRVGVHTVQVNGERVEKMDKVSASIQRYLDHSRFLTTQSAQMLRKAVTLVASRKADEAAMTLAPGCSRAEQEQKYLHCFFGRDFIEELRQLDSEFLRTGNKLLSLHSMDSTSLSAALFLLALAKNDIRLEILQEWQSQLQGHLPQAEMDFYLAGLACADKCGGCCDKKFCVLAQNAKFVSFLGFFNAEVQGTDTLTPVQREFVRLAQIFKTRLVTELELKQRVMERTLLEERLGDYRKELEAAKVQEDAAKADHLKFQKQLQGAIAQASGAFASVEHEFDAVDQGLSQFRSIMTALATGSKAGQKVKDGRDDEYPVYLRADGKRITDSNDDRPDDYTDLKEQNYRWLLTEVERAKQYFDRFNYPDAKILNAYKAVNNGLPKEGKTKVTRKDVGQLAADLAVLFDHIQGESRKFRGVVAKMLAELRKDKPDIAAVLELYGAMRADVKLYLKPEQNKTQLDLFDNTITPAFTALQNVFTQAQASARVANLARRPLDEKKLLDMLVDEMEDKYIELLDGTRAHTANVDNYLKALATALDDDFNTQFYQPAFSKIRTLGAGWDVQLGQIESTTVLTNNRMLGKVSPAASMEFDLPRRDIALREAFKGAKAAVQDYGALLNDPVFLSLVKAYGGMPPAGQFGGAGGGLPAVRNVLPGLPTSADELLLAQAGSPRREFGTNLESLIPDPAIYKFETGTGYEIRPVISPDGQAVVFGFDYMYTTDVREPVRADEKHLGRVKRHYVHTDVNLGNYELREVSKYWVSLKAARTGQGVQLLQDIPGVGALFRPAPSASSSLQQNLIYSQAAIFPTLFDLMGLRYAPAVADIDPEFTKNDEFVVRGRRDYLRQFIFDYGASRVDDALRIMYGERRPDLYRSQHTIPWVHPNGYQGPGLRQRDAELQEGYDPVKAYPPTKYAPGLHAPIQPDRDPAGDSFGHPGRPLTLPGGGHSSAPYHSQLPPGGYPPLQAKPPVAVNTPKEPTVKPPTVIGTAKVYTAKPLGTIVTPDPAPKPPVPTVTPLPPDRLPPPAPAKITPTPATPVSVRPSNDAPLPSLPPLPMK